MKRKTYLREHGENDVKGIVVVEAGDGQFRVTENREPGIWCKPFWMPEAELDSYNTEHVGLLPDEKFEKVVSLAEA